jgi:hypothetical protein
MGTYCGGGTLSGGAAPAIGSRCIVRALTVSALTVRAPSGQQQHPASAREKTAIMK